MHNLPPSRYTTDVASPSAPPASPAPGVRWSRLLRAAATFGLLVLGLTSGALPASALAGSSAAVAVVAGRGGNGYAIISAAGGQYNYGGSAFSGSLAGTRLNAPIVAAAAVPGTDAKWFAASDGGVFTEGAAPFFGSMGGKALNQPITAILASSTGRGYLLVAKDGGTFAFGDFPFPGSLAGLTLNSPIVGAAATPDGRGVWLVAGDGGCSRSATLASTGLWGAKL